ncbi:MAG: hypothetical protein IKN64_11280 [Desulfovibrio sp.]|nr:hypothetical protein [Desulfovibrio sp.]
MRWLNDIFGISEQERPQVLLTTQKPVSKTCNQQTHEQSGLLQVTGCTGQKQHVRKIKSEKEAWASQESFMLKEKYETSGVKCCECEQWQKLSFCRGLCQLTMYETASIAHCRQVANQLNPLAPNLPKIEAKLL